MRADVMVAQAPSQLLDWDWIGSHGGLITNYLSDHVVLTVGAISFGLMIAFPLALIAVRYPRFYGPILSSTAILYTIPSIALFLLMIPITGLGIESSLVGLTIYTLLVLVRNTVVGLRGVPREVTESAQAMGYTRTKQLFRVEMPLAIPVIMAGIRIATVTTIGLITVTALIGQDSLGQLITVGFVRNFPTMVMVGFVLCVALAIAADLVLVGMEKLLTPWTRDRR